MLIETPYKIGDIVSLKLNSGEELIGRLEAEDAKGYTMHKPMALVAGQQGIGLAPFMFSVSPDAKLNINASTVTCISKTEGEIGKQYTTQTTGIQMT